jgi:transposase
MDRRGNAHLSAAQRGQVVSLFESGRTVSQMAAHLNVDRKTVYKWLKRNEEGDASLGSKQKSGRPRCTNMQQDEDIREAIRQNP